MNIKIQTEAEIQIERERAAAMRAAWPIVLAELEAEAAAKNKRISWAQQLRADMLAAGMCAA